MNVLKEKRLETAKKKHQLWLFKKRDQIAKLWPKCEMSQAPKSRGVRRVARDFGTVRHCFKLFLFENHGFLMVFGAF